jgi:hypothetical protein
MKRITNAVGMGLTVRAVPVCASLLVAAVVSSNAFAAGCLSPRSSGTAVVPDVVRMPLDTAITRLLARHLRISIPHFIPFRQAMAEGGWVRVGTTRALTAPASICGLDGLVVATQTPAPGTLVPWQGIAAGGVTPSRATVTIGLVHKAPDHFR